MSNEIKQGDTVRVSKDAPELYTMYGQTDWESIESTVEKIDGDAAEIKHLNELSDEFDFIAIPIKYLVKVDAEVKEAKAKIGSDKWVDKTVWNYKNHKKGVIRRMTDGVAEVFTEDGRLQTWQIEDLVDEYDDPIEKWKCPEPTAPKIKVGDRVRNVKSDLCGIALKIEHGIVEVGIPYDKERHYWNTDIVELFEPTEQTEAEEDTRIRQMEAELDEFRKAELDRVLHPEKPIFEVTIDNVAMNWQRYEADLAKEVVLKVVNNFNDPEQAAEYAVSVAKSVVEGLKKK